MEGDDNCQWCGVQVAGYYVADGAVYLHVSVVPYMHLAQLAHKRERSRALHTEVLIWGVRGGVGLELSSSYGTKHFVGELEKEKHLEGY